MQTTLNVFTIRNYEEDDLESVVKIYQSVFAEPPWLENWSKEEVIKDLQFAFSQQFPIALVAEFKGNVIGFTWGYKLPLEKFPFLKGKVDEMTSYGDEIGVEKKFRRKEVGIELAKTYMKIAKNQGMKEFVVRTDFRNEGSIPLLKSLGMKSLDIKDPEYPYRGYFSKFLLKEFKTPSFFKTGIKLLNIEKLFFYIKEDKMKIIFICKYNAFRSRIAESYFNRINKNRNIKVISRGFIVGISAGKNQIEILKKSGIKIEGKSKQINLRELVEADKIIVVANDIPEIMFDYKNIDLKKKLIFWKIPDEQKGRKDKINKIVKLIKNKVEELVEELKWKQ